MVHVSKKTRKFNGETYSYAGMRLSKRSAEKQKEIEKRKGFKVRIVKRAKGLYVIYIRKG